MSPRDSHSTLVAACLVCAAACVGPPLAGEHDLSIRQDERFVTPGGETVGMSFERPEAWSFTDGAWASLELDPAARELTAAPPGPIYVRYGNRWIVTRAPVIQLGRVRLGRPDRIYSPLGSELDLTVDELAPWQGTDQVQVYSAGTALWSLESPDLASGATSWSNVFDFLFRKWAMLRASRGDELWLLQMSDRALDDTRYSALVRGARGYVEMREGEVHDLAVQLTVAPPATFDVDFAIGEFDRVRLEQQPLIASSWYDIGVAALVGADTYGHFDVSADLAIARFDDHSGRDASGRMDFGDPFPAAWTRMATFVAWYPLALEGITAFDSVWSRDRADVLDGRTVRPMISAPRQLTYDGDRVRWLAPSQGQVAGYRVTVYRITDRLEVAGEIHCVDQDVRIPPGMLPAGVASAVQVTAIAGPMDLATAPFSLGLPYGEASITSSINRR